MGSTKTRSPRRKAFLRMWVRDDISWTEMTVQNVSDRGMMLRGKRVPERGTMIEICVGEASIAAEVRWAVNGCCGVGSRESIDVEALLNSSVLKAMETPSPSVALTAKVRKLKPDELAEQSRVLRRLIDRGMTILLVVLLAMAVVGANSELLGRPLRAFQSQMARPS